MPSVVRVIFFVRWRLQADMYSMACGLSPHRLAGISSMALETNNNGVQEA